MKTAMKRTTGILAVALTVCGTLTAVAAQNPDAIDNARSVAKSLQQKQANDTNAALDAAGTPAAAKPAPGAPAPAVKPAVIPGDKPAGVKPATAAKPAVVAAKAPAVKADAASGSASHLQRVNVVPGTDDIQIELSSTRPVTPRVTKLNGPVRIVVELPETTIAGAQNKIPVGSSGVKGVRIGMDGKTPPTTSVVVDLEKSLAYDVAPGPGGKITLILHTQGSAAAPVAAKNTVPAKPSAKPAAAPIVAKVAAKPEAKVKTEAKAEVKPAAKAEPKIVAVKAPAPKVAAAAPKAEAKVEAKKDAKAEPKQPVKVAATPKPVAVPIAAPAPVKAADASKPKQEDKKWAMNGKRDPFFSPVIQQAGSGCSTGKKCLEINAINLRGVVKSEVGFIAVVTNNLGKAYFLRENDPVFNGYVMRITGDSVVFQETIQDKLGKSSTREVVKRIFTPAV